MKDKQKFKLEYANFIWYDIQFSLKKPFALMQAELKEETTLTFNVRHS